LKEKMSKPKQTLINESDDGHVVRIADIMRAELPLLRFNAPIAIFGGCYSNLEATVALFEHLDRLGIPASHRICTGDIVAYGADAEACVQLVRGAAGHVVMGNCEESLAAAKPDCDCGFPEGSACQRLSAAWFAHADRQISPESRYWMDTLPRRIDLEIGGARLAVVHGGMVQINQFIFASTSGKIKASQLNHANVDGVIGGHCGVPFSQSVAGRLWHNSGAVGMPANDGTARIWFSIITPMEHGLEIQHRAISYDHAAAAEKMHAADLPKEYAFALDTGLWPNCDILPAIEVRERGVPFREGTILWPYPSASKSRGPAFATALWPQEDRDGLPHLSKQKFRDPLVTADGQPRAIVELEGLETLWLNTGSLCNIECRNCYIESSPTNDRLVYLSRIEARSYLEEIARDGLPTREIGFTGGEPFMNPDILGMIKDCLDRGFEVLVLSNAMLPMQRLKRSLLDLKSKYGSRFKVRISLDHYSSARHEDERGPNTFQKTLDGLIWLARNGFNVSVAGRTMWGEDQLAERSGYAALFAEHSVAIDADDPIQLVLFPEMDARVDVPEITNRCWGILRKSPADVMCSRSRMVVKRKGSDRPTVVACTLIPYEKGFELGTTLKDASGQVALNHPHCARFCILGGASCSVAGHVGDRNLVSEAAE
jgi:pyruvate-formate lyase-activating enzyme/predicted phosphodiesterase